MESPVIVKTEVEEGGGEAATKWVNTKGHCFLCLERSAAVKVICLQGLLRHLQINRGDVSMVGGSAEFPAHEWDKITVDLCNSCGTRASKLNTLLKELEKIQMEVKGLLEQTHNSISESLNHPKLLGTFVEKMTKEAGTLLSLGIATNLRKEVLNKVSALVRAPNAPTEISSASARAEMEVDEPEASTSTSASEGNSKDRTGLPNKRLGAANIKATTEKGRGLLTRLQNSRQGGKTGKDGSKEKPSSAAGDNILVTESECPQNPDFSSNEVEGAAAALPVSNASSPCCSTSKPTELPERRKNLKTKPSAAGNSIERTSDEDDAELESETSETEEAPEVIPEIRKPWSFYCTKKSGWFSCKKCGKKTKEFNHLLKHYKALHLRIETSVSKRSRRIEGASAPSSTKAATVSIVNRDSFLRTKYKYSSMEKKGNSYIYKYACEECSKTFSKSNDLQRHVQRVHQGMITIRICDKCQKTFMSSQGLKKHLTRCI